MNESAFIVATGQLQKVLGAEISRHPHGQAYCGVALDRQAALVVGAVTGNLMMLAAQDACSPPTLTRERECSWVLGLAVYQVWAEGYRASGDRADATLLGTARAATFRGAVEIIRDRSDTPELFTVKGDRCFFWECELFDNEADARRRFG